MAQQASASLSVEAYQELSDIDHVLRRPDMYIGPIDRVIRQGKCLSMTERKIIQKQIVHSEGEEQTFLEIIANAADNVQQSREHNIDPGHIEVTITAEWVIIKNYGMNIPVAQNENGKWVPQLIFGQLRTSSKYDDSKQRLYIGKNGIGSKATNIFSRVFIVECSDPARGLLYKQMWQNNMTVRSDPEITSYSGVGYTQISYSLDFARFGVTGFDQEALEIYGAHCAAVSYTCAIPVFFNGQRIEIKDIFEYGALFFPITRSSAISYKDPNGSYDLCLIDTPDSAVCVSFVNGMITSQGGVHVDAAYKVIVDTLIKYLGKAVEGIRLTKRDISNHVSMFIACRLPNPQFKSQTKDCLARPEPKIELPENLLKGIKKWQLIERIVMDIQRKQLNKLKKTDGKKKRAKIESLEDSNLAQTSRSTEGTLILIEGDSASQYAVKFLSQVPNGQGRNFYGILPLHGKLLNVLNADFLQVYENRDLSAIKAALGLKEEVDYSIDSNYRQLRYGSVLIMPDADNDGKHILGLVTLFFLARFPSLVQRGYIKFLRTPVVRATVNKQRYLFYSMSAFKRFMSNLPQGTRVSKIHYFKGLGSSEDHHIKEDFENPRIVTFRIDPTTAEKVMLAFHKTASHLRKQWLADWADRELIDTDSMIELPLSLFIDYELIDYSIENIIRSIPEAIDGMKESQRKVFFAALRKLRDRNNDKIKVAQVASHAAEITCYKHGESCLADTIMGMTYSFVGSNNMPYFVPRGQFGTRNKGGKDAANPRYTCISLPWWTDLVYRKDDKRLEKSIIDEGKPQECENFFPILPMHVINGVVGIGTAWSTNIPAHNPLDIAFFLQQRLLQDLNPEEKDKYPLPTIRPWYKGFTGNIIMTPNGFISEGRMTIQPDQSIVIDELPIGTWTFYYYKDLEDLEDQGLISGLQNFSTDDKVKFIIHKYNDGAPTPKKLKLINKHSTNNMTVLYRTADRGIKPKIYNDITRLLEDFYTLRLAKYTERKILIIEEIDKEIHTLNERARFIQAVLDKQIKFKGRPKQEVYANMDQMRFDRKLLNDVKSSEYTLEEIASLQSKVEAQRQKRQETEAIRSEQLWYNELEEFILGYCKHEKCKRSTFETCVGPSLEITLK